MSKKPKFKIVHTRYHDNSESYSVYKLSRYWGFLHWKYIGYRKTKAQAFHLMMNSDGYKPTVTESYYNEDGTVICQ